MLRWELDHPTAGHITLEQGNHTEMRAIDENWPAEGKDVGKESPFNESPVGASLKERLAEYIARPGQMIRVQVNGQVVGRYNGIPSSLPLEKNLKSGKYSSAVVTTPGKGQLKLTTNFLGELLVVAYKKGSDYLEFDPPAGSRAEAYAQTLEASPSKRVVFPLLFGISRSVWYIAILLGAPLIGRFFSWLWSLLPDFGIRLPHPPALDLPVITLPSPPSLDLPVPSWRVPWPSVDPPAPPDWVLFLLEHSKAWVPLLLAIIFAVLAVCNSKKSKQRKAELNKRRHDSPDADKP